MVPAPLPRTIISYEPYNGSVFATWDFTICTVFVPALCRSVTDKASTTGCRGELQFATLGQKRQYNYVRLSVRPSVSTPSFESTDVNNFTFFAYV